MIRSALTALLIAVTTTGCLQVQWMRSTLHQPIGEEVVDRYAIGEATMGDALGGLGAPLYVWELPHGSAALAWGWYGSRDLGVQVSLPTKSYVDPSFRFSQIDNRLRGYVMVFDAGDDLRYVRKGYLADIADDLRRKPVFLVDGPQDVDEGADG